MEGAVRKMSGLKLNSSRLRSPIEGVPKDCTPVVIGPNGTIVPKHVIDAIKWNSQTKATRALLLALFDPLVLATHKLTVKQSNDANSDRQPQHQLDEKITEDIIDYVTTRLRVTDLAVRKSIAAKCAEEKKIMRERQVFRPKPSRASDGISVPYICDCPFCLDISVAPASPDIPDSPASPDLPYSPASPDYLDSPASPDYSGSPDSLYDEYYTYM